ncbi:hypothetical protein C8J56DRAFT_886536 [Mycena floridula]|nr:hypothetical protein C8J56DRAFT_886536 [Mycena floridula]
MALTLTISGSSTLTVGDTLVCTWTAISTDPATFLLGIVLSPTGPNADTTPLTALAGGPLEIDRNGETTGTKTMGVLSTTGSYILGAAPATGGLSVGDPRSQSTMTSSDGAKAPTVASSSSDGTTVSSSSHPYSTYQAHPSPLRLYLKHPYLLAVALAQFPSQLLPPIMKKQMLEIMGSSLEDRSAPWSSSGLPLSENHSLGSRRSAVKLAGARYPGIRIDPAEIQKVKEVSPLLRTSGAPPTDPLAEMPDFEENCLFRLP